MFFFICGNVYVNFGAKIVKNILSTHSKTNFYYKEKQKGWYVVGDYFR